ncbi:DALR anticodon-binding domain-containing protein [Kamptonema animale CS-326]|uniref:DALR anticodon-binding domain-containing protein n=1 Tax=Kamptonema animale TaxID=92934 RepID=UPI00232F8C22|nr:DALR anticodon-binding domain-containing protein [Kamptonema animale]MDB9510913.1 DALR anticodon-binding domain-containing protein [Kamptonema animale CS-326]
MHEIPKMQEVGTILVLGAKGMLLKLLEAAIASPKIALEEIPLQRTKDARRVQYISAIALKLAHIWQQPAIEVATQLAAKCQKEREKRGFLSKEDFTIEVLPSTMILFELTDVSIAAWLQYLTDTPQTLEKGESQIKSVSVESDRIFPVQYSHARCCSLLRLADRDRIIDLVERDRQTSPPHWQIINPNPIPWLNSNNCLRLVHPAELNLISQLFTTVDTLACLFNGGFEKQLITNKSTDWIKLAHTLSDAFQTFYSQCRIWGEVKTETPKLAQARLGLILATQTLLQFILQELLGVIAPLEL